MASEVVEILLKLRNARVFQRDADASAKSVGKIGTEAEESGEKAKRGWKDVAKWAGGAAAFAGTAKFFKDSISSTQTLAKSTMALQRSTGLDTETASAWATVTKARGIETKQFQMGLTKLSKTMNDARLGNDKANATLKTMGVGLDTITSGNVNQALMEVADGFSRTEDPAKKAALAQQLFGRSALALRPLLDSGSAGIEEQLALAEQYGATLSEDTVGGAKDMIAQQREMSIAFEGLKVQLGTSLMPVLSSLVAVFAGWTRTLQPLLRNATLVKIAVSAMVVAFVALKAASAAATIQSTGLTFALIKEKVALVATAIWTKTVTAAQWLWNAAMAANPIGLIIIGLVALGAALVIAYKKSETFRNIVNGAFNAVKKAAMAVFNWIKSHWPLLVSILGGPFGTAIVLVIKNFDKLKAAAKAVADWIVAAFRKVVEIVNEVGDKIGSVAGTVKDIAGGAAGVGKALIPGLATGGTVQATGTVLVGEAGPELVRLPRGAEVFPTPAVAAMAGVANVGTQTIITQVFLDRRQIAEAVGTYGADRLARR